MQMHILLHRTFSFICLYKFEVFFLFESILQGWLQVLGNKNQKLLLQVLYCKA